jgi:hypothetical protein
LSFRHTSPPPSNTLRIGSMAMMSGGSPQKPVRSLDHLRQTGVIEHQPQLRRGHEVGAGVQKPMGRQATSFTRSRR